MTQAPATPELVERLEPDATPAFSGDGPHTESPAPDSCADDTCPDHDPKGFVGEPRWRCFHCEFATSDEDEALQHFGPHPIFDPACKMTDAGQRREYIALDAAYSQVCKANKEAAAALEAQQARIAELEGLNRQLEQSNTEMFALVDAHVKATAGVHALADRYEKALREIQDLPFSATPGRFSSDIARQALSSQGRREGVTSGFIPELPCGVGPSDLTDHQPQHSDGEG